MDFSKRVAFWLLVPACVPLASHASPACTPPAALSARLEELPDATHYAEVGRWFVRHRQSTCAAAAFSQAVKQDPNSAQYAYLLGLSLLSAGEPKLALDPLQQSLRIEPKSVDTHLALGTALEALGSRTDAELQYRVVLSFEPKSAAALENLSRSLLADRSYVSVIELLRPVAASSQLSAASAVNLSVAYTKAGLPNNASEVLHAALQNYPSSVPLIEASAALLVLQDRYGEARTLLSDALRVHPHDAQLERRYLHVLVLAKDPEAEPLCKRLLTAKPSDWELLYLMGLLKQLTGDDKEAQDLLQKSVAQNPTYPDSRFHLGVVLLGLGDNLSAKVQLEKAIALGYGDPGAHYILGKTLKALGEHDAEQEEFRLYKLGITTQADHGKAATESSLADQAQASGNFAEAAVHYREALRLAPNEALMAYRLAMALDQAGDRAGERSSLTQAIEDNPRMAEAQNQLGYLDYLDGQTDIAIEHFRLSTQADPAYTKAWINLAAALCLTEQWKEARASLEQVIAIDPGNPAARQLLQQITTNAPQN